MVEGERLPSPAQGGAWLVWLCAAGTSVFVVLSLAALAAKSIRPVLVSVDAALFLAGGAAFVAAIVLLGARALRSGVGVRATGLFLGGFAGRRDRAVFQWCFGLACVVGLGAALANRDPEPLVVGVPAMAFGVLVPVFAPGLAGVHSARYCAWPMRGDAADDAGEADRRP